MRHRAAMAILPFWRSRGPSFCQRIILFWVHLRHLPIPFLVSSLPFRLFFDPPKMIGLVHPGLDHASVRTASHIHWTIASHVLDIHRPVHSFATAVASSLNLSRHHGARLRHLEIPFLDTCFLLGHPR